MIRTLVRRMGSNTRSQTVEMFPDLALLPSLEDREEYAREGICLFILLVLFCMYTAIVHFPEKILSYLILSCV